MYPVNWIDSTGWNLKLPEYSKRMSITANTLLYKAQDCDLNIFLYSEPPEIIPGIDRYCQAHYRAYDYILTWDEDILNHVPNARKLIYIDPWITNEFKEKEKEFEITFLSGVKNQTYGHNLRLNIYNMVSRIKIPHDFYHIMDFNRHLREDSLFSNSQFNIAIENSVHNNYFTEKVLDCFLTRTIPVYYGCPNIGNWFDIDGIIKVDSDEDLFNKVNDLDDKYYWKHYYFVEKNYTIAREMCNDLGVGGYKTLDRKLNELIVEKYGHI